jgi:hypothetical protein
MSNTIKMIRYFEGIRVFTWNIHKFNQGAACTIPGIGIFVGTSQAGNTDLLRHEFGHILQQRQKGVLYFWIRIVPVSVWSAFRASYTGKHVHMHTRTEWTANLLSYNYFKQPVEWDFDKYPIQSEL